MADKPRDPPPEDSSDDSPKPKQGGPEDELRSLVEEIVGDPKNSPPPERPPTTAPDTVDDIPPDPDVPEPRDPDHDPLEPLRGILPKTEEELRALVREIVGEVLQDVERGRREAAEPVQVVALPQMFIPRISLTRKQWTWTAVILAVLIGAPLTWLKWPRTAEIPDGAVGLWTTLSPRYADRSFRLTKNTLTIHLGPQDSTFHPIVRVEAEEDQEENATQYTVFYEYYRDTYEFHFLYDEDPDTTIKFVNQREMVWRKQAPGTAPPAPDGT